MSVHLRQASVKLMRSKTNCSEGQLLFDFEFQNVKVEHESRPRTGSYMFSLRLGAIYLRDKITTNSLFPLLISPQSSEDAPLYPRSSQDRFAGFAESILSFLTSSLGPGKEEEEPLLDFLYERKPFSSRADHRIHVKSQPLDIVYNPIVIKVVDLSAPNVQPHSHQSGGAALIVIDFGKLVLSNRNNFKLDTNNSSGR